MANKIWINRIYSFNEPADLSNPISLNFPVEFDLRGKPSNKEAHVNPGDIMYIAVNGSYEFRNTEVHKSLRIVAKGVVDNVYIRGDIPVVAFVQGKCQHLNAPMINGLDVKRLLKDFREYETPPRNGYWSITADEADYIDKSIFSGVKII